MRNTSPNRLFLPALVLSQCLASSALSWQGQSSPNLVFSPRRSSFSPLQKSASSSRFLRIHPPRRRNIHLNGDDGEGHTGERQSMTPNIAPLESQASVPAATSTSTPSLTPDVTAVAPAAPAPSPEEIIRLQYENKQLRESLRRMEIENSRLLHDAPPSRIILETFEGERKIRRAESMMMMDGEMAMDDSSMWCDELEDDACPVEPMISFGEALRDRAYWLVGLLILQSGSGLILARNEALLANHPVIIYYLTMLVGAGGNAGNQASVRVIRGLALGTLNEGTQMQFLTRELKMAGALCGILSVTGFVRALAFRTPLAETIAITAALALIVFTSICLGAILPLILKRVGVDPAHSSTSIQVIMDILGVVCAVAVSGLVLDSQLGKMLVTKLTGGMA